MSDHKELLDKLITYSLEGKDLNECLPEFKGADSISDRQKLFLDIIASIDTYRIMCRQNNGGHATFIDSLYGTVTGKHELTHKHQEKLKDVIVRMAVKKAVLLFDMKYGPMVTACILNSLTTLEDYFSRLATYPIETVVIKNIDYRKKILYLKDNVVDYQHQINDRNRILDNLQKTVDLDVPGIRIHLLKDLYLMSIERGYYQACCRIMQRLAYLDDDRKRVEQMAEKLMSVKHPICKEDGTYRSDLREIRNAFAHPVGIDKGSYYHLRLSDDYVVDLYDTDLLFYTFMEEYLSNEIDQIVDVMVAIELYKRYRQEF